MIYQLKMFLDKHRFGIATGVMIATAITRLVPVINAESHSWDEPFHLESSLSWWQNHFIAPADPNPAFSRLALGALPFAAGLKTTSDHALSNQTIGLKGLAVLTAKNYRANLVLCKSSAILWLVFLLLGIYKLTLHVSGKLEATASVFLVSTAPVFLAIGSTYGPDIVASASLVWALFLFLRWLNQPSFFSTLLIGVATAFACLAKMSLVIWVPILYAGIIVATGFKKNLLPRKIYWSYFGLTVLIISWSLYFFDFGFVGSEQTHGTLAYPWNRFASSIPVPAPAFFGQILMLKDHLRDGHLSFFMGETGFSGFLLYFPILLITKFSIGWIALFVSGIFVICQSRINGSGLLKYLLLSAGICFSIAIFSRLNIGVRHIAPLASVFCVFAAIGFAWLWRKQSPSKVLAGIIVGLISCQSILAHPYYLSSYALWVHSPENIAVDSNLDWGQDLERLANRLRVLQVPYVQIAYFGFAELNKHNLPDYSILPPKRQTSGWVAISLSKLKNSSDFDWLKKIEPIEKIGSSILLYYIP